MDQSEVSKETLDLLKLKLGISTQNRDSFLTAILMSVISEMKLSHNIILNQEEHYDLMFLIDFAIYRYRSEGGGMPRSLQYRLHNMILTKKEAGELDG